MSLFANLKSDGLEETQDRLGGGGGAIDSDLYTIKVKAFFAGQSQKGAHSITIIGDIKETGKEYRETIYITNQKGENFFLNKQDKTKKVPLPGYVTIDDICMLTTEKPLSETVFEEKVVNVYDFDAKKELPKKVMCAVEVQGQEILAGIMKKIENKNVKNEATGEYEATSDTRESNYIDKVFHAEVKLSVPEARAGKEEAEFFQKWQDKNKGTVRDEREIKDGQAPAKGGIPQKSGSAPAADSAPKKSLFGKK
jgi:hypothetical protein